MTVMSPHIEGNLEHFTEKDLNWTGFLTINWKLYRTSLLVNPNNLEQKATTALRLFGSKYESADSCDLSFAACNGLRVQDDSPAPVLVKAFVNAKLLYKGYFLNWSSTPEKVCGMDSLPILLVKAKETNAKRVHDAIGKAFDCLMTPMELNTSQLAGLCTAFIRTVGENENGTADFQYYLPGLRHLGSISTTSRIRELAIILRIYATCGPTLGNEDQPEWIRFYEALLRHFYGTYQLDLRRAELFQVSLSSASATHRGQLRVNSENLLFEALQMIDSFLTSFPAVPPPMSLPSNSDSD